MGGEEKVGKGGVKRRWRGGVGGVKRGRERDGGVNWKRRR
jgi:hypothetical protein